MRRLAVVIVVAACSSRSGSNASDPCDQAYQQMIRLHAFDAGYRGQALAFGIACGMLTPDDVACLSRASSATSVAACSQPAQLAATARYSVPPTALAPLTATELGALADEICACKDDACLVGVGEHRPDALVRALRTPPSDDTAASSARVKACLHDEK